MRASSVSYVGVNYCEINQAVFEALKKAKDDIASLRETLQNERELVETLTKANENLKVEMELTNADERNALNEVRSIGGRAG